MIIIPGVLVLLVIAVAISRSRSRERLLRDQHNQLLATLRGDQPKPIERQLGAVEEFSKVLRPVVLVIIALVIAFAAAGGGH
ncbi:hypothetical protein ACVW1C_001877 [Bradyrhizobium sp. USDA 4011]